MHICIYNIYIYIYTYIHTYIIGQVFRKMELLAAEPPKVEEQTNRHIIYHYNPK